MLQTDDERMPTSPVKQVPSFLFSALASFEKSTFLRLQNLWQTLHSLRELQSGQWKGKQCYSSSNDNQFDDAYERKWDGDSNNKSDNKNGTKCDNGMDNKYGEIGTSPNKMIMNRILQ